VGGLLYLNWLGNPFQYAPNNQLEQAKQTARFVFEKAGNEPFNFALITADNSDYAYRYFFEIWGNTPVVIENEQIDPARLTVTNQLLVICEVSDCQPLGNPLWEVAGFGPAEIQGKWQVQVGVVLTVFRLVHVQR